MLPDLDMEDRQAVFAVAAMLVGAAAALYALKLAGFKFVIGVGE